MTLDEAIELANQGDAESMYALGKHYYVEHHYDEAQTWYCRAAKAGLKHALVPAALTTCMVTNVKRHLSGGDAITDEHVRQLGVALDWLDQACAAGIKCDSTATVAEERALCACAAAKKDGSAISQEKALRYLKDVYEAQGASSEVVVTLACALYQAEELSDKDSALCFELLKRCTALSESDVPYINLGVSEAYLGFCYLEGKGTDIDVNAAHDCFVRAGQKGFDCSGVLGAFKKRLREFVWVGVTSPSCPAGPA